MAGDQAGRVDSWIWSVRLTATRSAAAGACRAGHVRVNGVRVKPAHAVRAGDEVRLRGEGRERVVVVQQVITKRVSASVAATCYIDNSPPPPPREEAIPVAVRDRGAGRPTKRERRSIEKLLGRPARLGGRALRLISGAIADRTKFGAWAVLTVAWATLVYFPSPTGFLSAVNAERNPARGPCRDVEAGVTALTLGWDRSSPHGRSGSRPA